MEVLMKEAMTEPAPPSKAQPLFRIAIENNQRCRYSEDQQTIIELLEELGLVTQPEGVHKTAHGDADEVVHASDGKGKKDEKKEQARALQRISETKKGRARCQSLCQVVLSKPPFIGGQSVKQTHAAQLSDHVSRLIVHILARHIILNPAVEQMSLRPGQTELIE